MMERFFSLLALSILWLSFQFAFLFHVPRLCFVFFFGLILKFQYRPVGTKLIKAAAQTFRHVFYESSTLFSDACCWQ